MSLSYFLYLFFLTPYFVLSFFLACYIPGNTVIKKLKLESFSKFVLSLGLGIILWGWQGYIFGYLHIRWFSYIYLLVFLGIWIKITKFTFHFLPSFNKIKKFVTHNIILLIIFLLGTFVQISPMIFVGVQNTNGFYSCCGDIRDNFVQIAITKAAVESIPPKEPGITGADLKNYHYWSGLANAELTRVFHLPLIPVEYQYMLIVLSVSVGLSLFAIGNNLRAPPNFTKWLLFFVYFGGDAIFLITFLLSHHFSFSMSSLEDGTKFFVNYPRGFAMTLFFVGLLAFIELLKNKKNMTLQAVTIILLGSLIGFKVYVGIFALIGLGTYACWNVLKRDWKSILLPIIAAALSLSMYIPANAGAGGLYFTGTWRLDNFIMQPGFRATRLELARLIYLRDKKWLKVFMYEGLYLLLYSIGTFGSKVLAFFQTKKSLKIFPFELHLFLLSGIILSTFLGFFFEQTSGGANTFNFLVSVFIIGSFYTAAAISALQSYIPSPYKFLFITIIVAITAPRIISETNLNITRIQQEQGTSISTKEIHFLSTLQQFVPNNKTILVDHNGEFSLDHESPYVYVFSGGNMYLSGVGNEIDSHNIPAKTQESTVTILLNDPNTCDTAQTLINSTINYIITDRSNYFSSPGSIEFLKKIYSEEKYILYQVNEKNVSDYVSTHNCSKTLSPFEKKFAL